MVLKNLCTHRHLFASKFNFLFRANENTKINQQQPDSPILANLPTMMDPSRGKSPGDTRELSNKDTNTYIDRNNNKDNNANKILSIIQQNQQAIFDNFQAELTETLYRIFSSSPPLIT